MRVWYKQINNVNNVFCKFKEIKCIMRVNISSVGRTIIIRLENCH